jgi:hypothetical protein
MLPLGCLLLTALPQRKLGSIERLPGVEMLDGFQLSLE